MKKIITVMLCVSNISCWGMNAVSEFEEYSTIREEFLVLNKQKLPKEFDEVYTFAYEGSNQEWMQKVFVSVGKHVNFNMNGLPAYNKRIYQELHYAIGSGHIKEALTRVGKLCLMYDKFAYNLVKENFLPMLQDSGESSLKISIRALVKGVLLKITDVTICNDKDLIQEFDKLCSHINEMAEPSKYSTWIKPLTINLKENMKVLKSEGIKKRLDVIIKYFENAGIKDNIPSYRPAYYDMIDGVAVLLQAGNSKNKLIQTLVKNAFYCISDNKHFALFKTLPFGELKVQEFLK